MLHSSPFIVSTSSLNSLVRSRPTDKSLRFIFTGVPRSPAIELSGKKPASAWSWRRSRGMPLSSSRSRLVLHLCLYFLSLNKNSFIDQKNLTCNSLIWTRDVDREKPFNNQLDPNERRRESWRVFNLHDLNSATNAALPETMLIAW